MRQRIEKSPRPPGTQTAWTGVEQSKQAGSAAGPNLRVRACRSGVTSHPRVPKAAASPRGRGEHTQRSKKPSACSSDASERVPFRPSARAQSICRAAEKPPSGARARGSPVQWQAAAAPREARVCVPKCACAACRTIAHLQRVSVRRLAPRGQQLATRVEGT